MLQKCFDLLFPRRSLTGVDAQWITDAEKRQFCMQPAHEETGEFEEKGSPVARCTPCWCCVPGVSYTP